MKGTIYVIKNLINGREYVGKTFSTVEKRFKQHLIDSRKERCEKRPLYSAIRKYGEDNFEYEALGEYEESIIDHKEKEFIAKRKTYKNGYNATLGGTGKCYLELDEQELIERYKSGETINQLSEFYNCDQESISIRLKNNKVPIKRYNRKKIMILELELSFDSMVETAIFLIENNYAKGNKDSVYGGIRRQLNKERDSYLGFHFEVVE